METKKKEPKKKAKYSMGRCIGYMLSLAWNHRKSVIGVSILLAIVSVALNLVQLYVAPQILERVEQFTVDGASHPVIVLKKIAPTPRQYPRRYAKIKQDPL